MDDIRVGMERKEELVLHRGLDLGSIKGATGLEDVPRLLQIGDFLSTSL